MTLEHTCFGEPVIGLLISAGFYFQKATPWGGNGSTCLLSVNLDLDLIFVSITVMPLSLRGRKSTTWLCVFTPVTGSQAVASQGQARGRCPVGNACYWNTWNHKSLGYWNVIAILNINLISLYSRNNVISMKKSKNKQWNITFWIRSKPNKNTDHNNITPAMASFQHPFGFFCFWWLCSSSLLCWIWITQRMECLEYSWVEHISSGSVKSRA